MKKSGILYFICAIFSVQADCFVGQNGINQWRLIYELGQCLNTTTDTIEACCSTLEKTLTALDLAFLTAIDFAQLTAIEPLVSALAVCDICSHFDLISTNIDFCCSVLENEIRSVSDVLGSKIDQVGTSGIDGCCSTLSTLDRIIISDVDSVSTKVDSVSSKIDLLGSKSDLCCSVLDIDIRSISDVLNSKVDINNSVISQLDTCILAGLLLIHKSFLQIEILK